MLVGSKKRVDKKYVALADVFKDISVTAASTTQPANKEASHIVPKAILTFMQAKQAYLNRDREKTVELLKRAISEDNKYVPARELLLKIYVENGKDELARQQAEEIIKINPLHPFANYVLGSLFLRNKQYQSSGRHLYIAYRVWQEDNNRDSSRYLATLAKLAASLSAQGYLSAAIEVYVPLIKQLEQLDNENLAKKGQIDRILQASLPEFYMIVGEFALRVDKSQLAREYFLKATKFSAVRKQAKLSLARCFYLSKQIKESKRILDTLVKEYGIDKQTIELYKKLYPNNEWIKHILAVSRDNCDVLVSLIRMIDEKELIKDIANTIVQMFADEKNTICMTTILLRKTNQSTGKKLLEALQSVEPKSSAGKQAYIYLLAIAQQIAGNSEQAQKLYEQVINRRKNYLPVYIAYGNFLLYMRDWKGLISLIDSAPNKLSKKASLLYLKGYALTQQSKFKQATDVLEQASQLAPQSERIGLALVEAYFQSGNFRQASAILGNIIKNDNITGETLIKIVDLVLNMRQVKLAQAIVDRYRRHYGADVRYRLAWMKIAYAANHNINLFRANLSKLTSTDLPVGLLAKERAQLEFDAANYKQSAEIAYQAYNSKEWIFPDIYKQLVRISAIAYWKLLEYDKAEQSWKVLIRYWPDDKFKAALAQMYMDAREYDKSASLLGNILDSKRLETKRLQLQMSLINALVRAGHLTKALAVIDSWLNNAKGIDVKRLKQLKLNACILAKNFDKAQQLVEDWLKENKRENSQWQRWLVMILLRKHQAKQALSLIDNWQLKMTDKNIESKNRIFTDSLRVPVLLAMKKYEQAIDIAKKLYKTASKEKRFSRATVLINCYQQAGKYNKAIELASELLDEYKSDSLYSFSLHKAIVTSLELAGKYQLAEDYIENQIAQSNSKSTKIRWQQILVSLYFVSNRIDKVIVLLEEIVRANPQAGWANNSLGYALALANKDLTRAEKLIRTALASEPGNSSYLDSLAWVLYKRDKFKQAYKYEMLAYKAMDEDEPVLLEHLGDICYKLGNTSQAREYWKRAVEKCRELSILDLEPNMPERIIKKLNTTEANKQ